jgi:hypothetical protein
MCHRLELVLVAVALMAASILQVVTSTATNSANLTGDDAAKTAYDVLEQNNLPWGLLPLDVKSYELQPGGVFQVTLPGECNFFVTVAGKQFKFRFESTVSGTIKSGSISRVSGVSIQVEFAWLGINQVSRAGDQLNIQLEKSTQSFPVSAFAQSARCS